MLTTEQPVSGLVDVGRGCWCGLGMERGFVDFCALYNFGLHLESFLLK